MIDRSLDKKNVDRFDQSPLPNYPNFDTSRESLGNYGWGTDKPSLNSPTGSLNGSIDRLHVKHWDKIEN